MRTIGYIMGAVALVGVAVATPFIHFSTMDEVSFTVDHRERVMSQDSEGKSSARYMVWGVYQNGDTEVFENVDSLLSMKFNSADLYGEMREGRLCFATVNGFRVPFLSMNRNVLDVSCNKD